MAGQRRYRGGAVNRHFQLFGRALPHYGHSRVTDSLEPRLEVIGDAEPEET
jgi:hypothetical protein